MLISGKIEKIFKVHKRLILVLLLFFYFAAKTFTQSFLSNYKITSYPAVEYNGAPINHCILQDAEGRIYSGNQFGLLIFDSKKWERTFITLNRSDIRALGRNESNDIFIGGQNEIGILTREEHVNYRYTRLNYLIPDSLSDFGIAWQFLPFLNKTAIRTTKNVMLYSPGEIKAIPGVINPIFMAADKGILYIINKETGLTVVNADLEQKTIYNSQLANLEVVFMVKAGQENFIIGTANQGIFKLNLNGRLTKINSATTQKLEKFKISCGIKLHDGNLAVGTRTNGLFILNKNLDAISHISDLQGLKNKRVISVYQDNFRNIWCSLENSISLIEYNSPFRYLNEPYGFNSPVNDHLMVDNKLLIACNYGLFQVDGLHNLNSTKQIIHYPSWKIQNIQGEILVSNHYGPFKYENENIRGLSSHTGIWNFQKALNSNILLAGTYQGILVYRRENKQWVFKNKLEGFNDGCKELLVDKNGVIWVAHGYKGVYRIVADEDFSEVKTLDFYDKKDGFPTSLFLKMFVIDDAIYFGTQRGVYSYNEESNTMEADEYFKSILGDEEQIRLLKQDDEGNIWFIKGEDNFDVTGIIEANSSMNSQVIKEPFQKLRGLHNPGFENIYFKDNYVFFGAKSGSIVFIKDTDSRQSSFKTILKSVIDAKDSVIFKPAFYTGDTVAFPTQQLVNIKSNSLKFEVVGVFFENSEETQYSYNLENYSEGWSEWSTKNTMRFNDLKPGKYVFKAKARNIYNIESEEVVFEFRIPLISDRNKLILNLGIALFFLLLIFIISRLIIKMKSLRLKLNRSDDNILSTSQKAFNRTRSEIKKLHVEKLKAEEKLSMIAFKLVAKDQQINNLSDNLRPLLPNASKENYKRLQIILKELDATENYQNNYSDFELYFDKANANFISRLKSKYPDLSSNDIKICVYLKLNYSTKDIANTLNITIKGVQAARLRLRKKLQLPHDVHLNDFLISF